MSSIERGMLLHIATDSIHTGLREGHASSPDLETLPDALQQKAACFVTLHHREQLRGCIGSLEPREPLAQNVAENAFNAAFRDPRFPELTAVELADLELDISVLGAPQAVSFHDEADLVAQLQPGRDGLILEVGGRRGTFLPSVWGSLPDAEEFLRQLKQKAGLPADFWSADIRVMRYGTESFGARFVDVE
ncbi:MAG TPA: AmmeMemoRadiSam system protein A [Gammaproteobacteria bacterium]|nr:AmmeMemoRadiSam system protein A [Gammaproteobacteria bacterium]